MSPSEILDAILEPSAKIHPDYASTSVALKSGRVLNGLLIPISETEVEVVSSATETARVRRTVNEEQSPSRISLISTGLHEVLSPGEMADLLTHLSTIELSISGSNGEAVSLQDILQATVPVIFRSILQGDETLQRPVWLGPLPGHPGKSTVVEMQKARVWLVEIGKPGRSLFVDVQKETIPGELTGLTGLAFHPDFARNGRYFLKMHAPREAGRLSVQIVERRATPDGPRGSGQPSKLVLKIPVFFEVPYGGHIAFGPDGCLCIGMADTGPRNDPRGHRQDLTTLLGKMSRIDVDHTEGNRPYSIQADNPFRDRDDARPEVWAVGFREPWRITFDPPTGNLWIGDVGQGLFEEVTIVRKGENHGWNAREGFRPVSDRYARASAHCVPPRLRLSSPDRGVDHGRIRLSRQEESEARRQVHLMRFRDASRVGDRAAQPGPNLDRRDRPNS